MDQSLTQVVDQFGFVALISFGLTYLTVVAIERSFKKYNKDVKVTTGQKAVIQGVFAFFLLLVPLEFQDVVLNNIKMTVGIVAGSTALWQIVKAI